MSFYVLVRGRYVWRRQVSNRCSVAVWFWRAICLAICVLNASTILPDKHCTFQCFYNIVVCMTIENFSKFDDLLTNVTTSMSSVDMRLW
jgi:hypothetical protein